MHNAIVTALAFIGGTALFVGLILFVVSLLNLFERVGLMQDHIANLMHRMNDLEKKINRLEDRLADLMRQINESDSQ